MNRSRLPLILMFLVLGMAGSFRVHAEAVHTVTWKNPNAYTNGTPIPTSLLTTVETRIYYSYDNQVWSLFATVPDGSVSWTGLLPPGESVRAYYTVTATIPEEGIESARSEPVAFPVIPGDIESVPGSVTIAIGNGADTYVNYGENADQQYSSEVDIRTFTWPIGTTQCFDCHAPYAELKKSQENVASRGFIKWDLSRIPAGATINNATLRLYLVTGFSGFTDSVYTVSVAMVTGIDPVIGQLNWNTRDGIDPWPGGEDGGAGNLAVAESSAGIGTNPGWVTWDVTKMVQEWVSEPGKNFGMAIDADNFAFHGGSRVFASMEHPDPILRPQLIVTYESMK